MKTYSMANEQDQKATKKYHAHFNNVLYTKAIQGKTTQYANALIDEALALCGSPHYKVSFRNWSQEAIAFLKPFV
jgi:hypothetical protein